MTAVADTHALNARLLRFRSHPEQEDAFALAEDLIAARRYGDARGVAVSAQTDDSRSDARLLVLEARAWYLDRDLVRAQAALVRAARLDPDCAEAFRWLGEVLLKRGDPARAQRALERAIELSPRDPDAERLLERARQLARHAPVPEAPPAAEAAAASPSRRTLQGPVASSIPPAPSESAAAARGATAARRGGQATPYPREAPAGSRRTPAPDSTFAAEEDETTASFRRSFGDESPTDTIPDMPEMPSGFDDLSDGELESPVEPSRPGTVSAPGARAAANAEPSWASRQSFSGTIPAAVAPPAAAAAPAGASSGRAVSSPGALSAAERGASRTSSAAGALRSPRTPAGLNAPSSSGAARSPSSPGASKSPSGSGGLRAPSSAGATRSPSSPGAAASPSASGGLRSPTSAGAARSPSSPGASASPSASGGLRAASSAGVVESPAFTSGARAASSAGTSRAPSSGGVVPSGSAAHARSPAAAVESTADFDVEVDDAAEERGGVARALGGRTGLGSAALPVEAPSAARWDAPSVVAMWPSLESLSQPPPAHSGAEEPALAAEEDAAHTFLDASDDEPAELEQPVADLPLGAEAGTPDEPERLLETLRAQGIFEPPGVASEAPPAFAQRADVAPAGTRLGPTLIGVWLTSLLLLAAGYFGWGQWIAHRHGTAAELVAEARTAAFESDYARLVDAERLLRVARDNHPRSAEVPAAELFVHAQRVLENGSRELSSLRSALARAERLHADPAHVAVARAVLAVYSGATSEVPALLGKAVSAAKGEPVLLYLVGRLEQRLGRPDAAAHLRAAADAAPALIAAALGLAEWQQERGETQEALAGLDAVLARKPQHLRAKLWRTFLTADEQEPARALKELDARAKHAREGAPIDRILWALSRARLLRRTGAHEPAAEALREAAAAGASEPRLLALVATEARAAGQLGVAQQAAGQAAAIAPESTAYRALLASILLERNDGERALRLLADLPAGEPALLRMRARAALQTGDPEALRASAEALDAQLAAGDKSGELAALRLRVRAALEPKPQLLSDARALLRRTPADPEALLATGEVALALREAGEAVRAFEQLAQVAPEDAQAQYLLGRARRMATDAKGAETALRRALELSPGYVGALAALGGLLLDSGKYAEADALYQQLSAHDALAGRLGRAEALLALGRIDDAQVQVSGVPEAQRDSAPAREVAAKVAIARRKPAEALSLLRPLVEGEQRKAAALALYGDALYAAEQVNTAAGAYDSALELDSELPEALLGRATVHLRAERPSDALELLEDAQRALAVRLRAPEVRGRMLALLGQAYLQRAKRGDEERARDLLRQAIRLPNPPAAAYFFLGESLGGRRTPEAAGALKRYLELEPRGDYADRARRALGPLL